VVSSAGQVMGWVVCTIGERRGDSGSRGHHTVIKEIISMGGKRAIRAHDVGNTMMSVCHNTDGEVIISKRNK
jgi:hypothetical protein